MRCRLARSAMAFVLALSMLLFSVPAAFADDAPSSSDGATQRVTVAVLGYPNYIDLDDDGNPTGYAVDLLTKIANYTGWEYDYVPMTLEEANAGILDGSVDILVGRQATSSIADKVDISERAMSMGDVLLVTRPDEDRYAYNDYSSFDGMRIGVIDGSDNIAPMEEALDERGVSFRTVGYTSDDEAKAALADGEVDALLMSFMRCDDSTKIIAHLSDVDLYFATNPARPELKAGVDEAMMRLLDQNPYYELQLFETWFGDALALTALTPDERDYARSHPTIRVGVCDSWHPYEYYDEASGSWKGLIISILDEVADNSGVTFEYVGYPTLQAMDAGFADGEFDVLSALSNHAVDVGHGVRLSDPVIESRVVTVFDPTAQGGSRAALVQGSFITSRFLEKTGDAYTDLYYESTGDALEAVRTGMADFIQMPAFEADYYTAQAKYSNLAIRQDTNVTQQYSMAVRSDEGITLLSLLDKGLANIPSDQMDAIVAANTDYDYSFKMSDLRYSDPIMLQLSLILLILLLAAIAVLVVLYSYTRRQKIALAHANETKDSFLFNMSHEMRTPLSAIKGMSKMAHEQVDDPVVIGYMDNIDIASDHMLQLVDDVLEMSRMNAGRYQLHPSPFDLRATFEALDVLYGPLATNAGLSWSYELDRRVHRWVFADELRLKQVLVNLLSNAIKYNREGGSVVMLCSFISSPDATCERLRFEVRDTGRGIAPEVVDKVFQMFERGGRDDTDAVSGTGLGLAISQSIVQMMGGSLEVESEPGEGSSFHFEVEFPLAGPGCIDQAAARFDASVVDLAGRTILVAEDNAMNAQIVEHVLEKRGARVDLAANGREALDLFEASDCGYYDLVVMDVRMPVMDGYAAVRGLRALDRTDSTVPVVALSANAFEDDVARSLAAGMDRHLAKPLDVAELDRALGELLDRGEDDDDAG